MRKVLFLLAALAVCVCVADLGESEYPNEEDYEELRIEDKIDLSVDGPEEVFQKMRKAMKKPFSEAQCEEVTDEDIRAGVREVSKDRGFLNGSSDAQRDESARREGYFTGGN